MKEIRIARKVDELRKIVLPVKLKRMFDIEIKH